MTDTTTGNMPTPPYHTSIEAALKAILLEVTPGQQPYDSDSYLPDHLVQAAQAAIAHHQHVSNAISTACWHLHHGRTEQALGRILCAARHLKQACTESKTQGRA